MVNGYRNTDWTSNSPHLKPVKKSFLEMFEAKIERFKTSFAFVSVIGVFFIGGLMLGKTSESHQAQNKYFSDQLSKTDSLIKIQKQFQERYRVQRAADIHLIKMGFKKLKNTDSVLMMLIDKHHYRR